MLKSICVVGTMLIAMSSASAEILLLKVTGDSDLSFRIDSNRAPDEIDEDGDGDGLFEYFGFYDVPGTFGAGVPVADVYFYTVSAFGGFAVDDFQGGSGLVLSGDGPQIFSGPVDAPTLVKGSYALTETGGGSGKYQLTISVVPEPLSWTMMMTGFASVGYGMRRKRQKLTVVSFRK